ncbi:MAG: helix-hairpin-helix domain-containing protein [Bacteroidota bacterium]
MVASSPTNNLQEWVAEIQESYTIKDSDSSSTSNNFVQKREKPKQVKKAYKEVQRPLVSETEVIEIKDLNRATAKDLRAIKGIGTVFSNRIVKFRDRLGGFSNLHQLNEVYGLTPDMIERIEDRFSLVSAVHPFDINNDSVKFLAKHPYISYDLAWILINYRKQHGDIKGVEDLSKIQAIDDSLIMKLRPYIK